LVLRRVLVFIKFIFPCFLIERRQSSGHNFPFGYRESRSGQSCNSANDNLYEYQSHTNHQPYSDSFALCFFHFVKKYSAKKGIYLLKMTRIVKPKFGKLIDGLMI